MTLDGQEVARGKDFRVGHRRRLEATDLVVFRDGAPSPLRLVLARRRVVRARSPLLLAGRHQDAEGARVVSGFHPHAHPRLGSR